MAKLLISTQVYENYGDIAQPYWKPKGGSDYVVKNFKANRRRSIADSATEAVMGLRSQIECDNQHIKESIIDFRIVADDYLTEFEQSQLDYEGSILFPAKELTW
jgi:hypothetical protein